MKNINKIVFLLLLISSFTSFSQDNIFIGKEYWRTKPTITDIEEKIKEGNSPNELNRFGFDPVVYALLENVDDAVIKHLLTKEGNDVNKLTHDGRTYIFWAAYKNNIQIVKHLLDKGAKTDIIDDKGYSLLNFVAVTGGTNTELYDLLIENGANVLKEKTPYGGNPLLLVLSSLKDDKLINYFTEKGLSLNDVDNNGNGAFNYTARKDNRKILSYLIEKGLPYKEPSENGDNAMLAATLASRKGYNSLEYFKYLEDLGINPNITNKEGKTPLHNLAKSNKDIETLQYFINKGVDVNQIDKDGNTALILASQRNSLEAITLFLKETKTINQTNKKGYTALTKALRNEPKVVELLIKEGADVRLIDKKGYDLTYHLFKNYQKKNQADFQEKLKLLSHKGLKVNSTQKDGSTLYHLAVENQNLDMLNLIKLYDIDINIKNKNGLTALQKAVMKGKNHKIIKYLLKNGANKNVSTDFDETLFDLAKENEALKNTDISYLQ